jgi:Histidine kinase-, DNA gyrase B-, and HSP90-like ATPase
VSSEYARLLRWLWAALSAMLLGLAGLIAFLHVAVADIGQMNRLIAEDTAPSVVALQGMSVGLSRLQSALRESLSLSADLAALRARIAEERRAFAENTETWLSLPIDPGEGELMNEAKRDTERLDDLSRRILAMTPATPPATREAFRRELDVTASDLEEVILRGAKINTDIAYSATEVVDRVGRRLLPTAVAIGAGSVVLAALALTAAYRVSRTEAALAERRALQQKNAELEAFSGRVAHDVLSPLMTVSLAVGLAEQRLTTPGDERYHGMLVRAGTSLQRVRQVVSDLLEFARAAGPPLAAETEDTGPGVPPEDRERIFDPFVRASASGPGLGLGLATVKRLAESHGGHVGLRSPARSGHGALFWVTLPAPSSP